MKKVKFTPVHALEKFCWKARSILDQKLDQLEIEPLSTTQTEKSRKQMTKEQERNTYNLNKKNGEMYYKVS